MCSVTPLFQIVAMCYRLPPGGSPGDGGRPHQEVSNARRIRGETSGRVEISAEEVRVQNMTEGAKIRVFTFKVYKTIFYAILELKN